MNFQKKLSIIPLQARAYVKGTVECIGDEWIFIDEINKEASAFTELKTELELFLNGRWEKGTLLKNGLFYLKNDNTVHSLSSGDYIRFQKSLPYAFKQLIEELTVESFQQFVDTLNSLSYSLFDCLYCHHFLGLLEQRDEKEGMNIVVFDNEIQICVVQHFFYRGFKKPVQDRFEFTKSDGKRVICTSLHT